MLVLDRVKIELGDFRLKADQSIPSGEITALMGSSGSGKSTLLAAIAGFLPPTRGQIRIAGRDLEDKSPGDRPLSMLFQDQNLFPHLTVSQNVGLGLRPDLRLSADQKQARDAALDRVGLYGLGDRLPRDLSGGQQSRAALARALLRDRPWLLLDEPFSALGPAMRHEMLELLRDTARDTSLSVLMVTHDPDDAKRVADRTALIADSILQEAMPTVSLFDNPTPALRDYLG